MTKQTQSIPQTFLCPNCKSGIFIRGEDGETICAGCERPISISGLKVAEQGVVEFTQEELEQLAASQRMFDEEEEEEREEVSETEEEFKAIPKQIAQVEKAKEEPKQRSTRTLWYPQFGLTENPFRYFEARQEIYADSIPFLETEMSRKLEALVESAVSCIIEGPRGCGKSSLISAFAAKAIKIITPRSVADIFTQIFEGFDESQQLKLASMLLPKKEEEGFDFKNEVCQGCFRTCRLNKYGRTFEETMKETLRTVESPCPILERTIPKFLGFTMQSYDFLMDVPDNLGSTELKKFVSLCDLIRDLDSTLIIFATTEQSRMLKETDTFARFPTVPFEQPNRDFFRNLYAERIKFAGGTSPFLPEVVERLIDLSNNNVRTFIENCNLVLVEMWIRGLTDPCGLQFLESTSIKKDTPQQFTKLFETYRDKWVTIKELVEEAEKTFNITVSERKMSSILSEHGYTIKKRSYGKTHVLINNVQ